MKNIGKFFGVVSAVFFGMSSGAMAALCGTPNLPPCDVPEPGTLSLVVLGVGGAIAIARYLKK